MQVFSDGSLDALAMWADLNQDLVARAGLFGGVVISVLIALAIVAIPFAVLSWLGPS